MYLETDFYLNRNKPVIENDIDLYYLLKEVFPELSFVPVKGSYRTSTLCFMIYLGYCASCHELASFFGPYFSSAPVRTKLAMLSKKGDALLPLAWTRSDMGAQRAYCLTPKGYDYFLSAIPDSLKPQGGKIKLRRSGGRVPLHDYGVGISLYSFLLCGFPFYFEKEEVYSTGRASYKQKGGLCVDCTIYLKREDKYRVYLEQDMGNETVATLIGKIGTYKRLGLTDAHTCLLFSSHSILNKPSCVTFSPVAIESLINDMRAGSCQSLYSYYTDFGSRLDDTALLLVKKLLVRTCVCSCEINGAPCPVEMITPRSELKRCITYDGDGRTVNGDCVCTEDFTLADMERYLFELKAECNAYCIRSYNQEQYRIAKQKYQNICSVLSGYVLQGYYSRDAVTCLLGGYGCYVLPSVLISNASYLFCPQDNGFMNKCLAIVSPYYDGILSCDGSSLSQPFYFSEHGFVIFRNAYVLQDGRTVCFEHIGKDVGAFIRCLYMCALSDVYPDTDLHIVAICDNDADMFFFCKQASYYMRYARFPEKKGFFLSFLMEGEVDNAECLLKGVTDPEMPLSVYIRTKAQMERLTSYVQSSPVGLERDVRADDLNMDEGRDAEKDILNTDVLTMSQLFSS